RPSMEWGTCVPEPARSETDRNTAESDCALRRQPRVSLFRSVRPARVHAPGRARLAVEPLEERTVPTIFTVTNLNDGGPGSLRQALTAANAAPDPDIIQFAAGLSGTINLMSPGSDDRNVGGDHDILNPVSIQGPGANLLTVRQTVADERVFDVRPPAGETVLISGLTISGGNGHLDGGGVRLPVAATVILSAVDISGNLLAADTGTG